MDFQRCTISQAAAEFSQRVGDNPDQRLKLCLVPVEILGGEHVQGHHGDVEFGDPVQELVDLLGPDLVTVGRGSSGLFRPSAVAVQDHTDMSRERMVFEASCQPSFVKPVDDIRDSQRPQG